MQPPSNRSFHIATELTHVDSRLVGAYVAILALALADPDSKFLFTPDQTLTENENVCNYELQLRHDEKRSTRLKISPSL